MTLTISNKVWHTLTVLLATVVLFLAVLAGAKTGQKQSIGATTVKNAQEIVKGLGYFNGDNNRYPTVLEYQDKNLMLKYFNYFPPYEMASGQCNENFVYKRISNSSIQLNFCLPRAVGNYQKGWNQITRND